MQGSPALADALRAAGATRRDGSRWRVLVGSDAELRGDARYRAAVDDPLANGA